MVRQDSFFWSERLFQTSGSPHWTTTLFYAARRRYPRRRNTPFRDASLKILIPSIELRLMKVYAFYSMYLKNGIETIAGLGTIFLDT